MSFQRVLLLSLATVIGFSCGGSFAGWLLGRVNPGLMSAWFQVTPATISNPSQVGAGVGCLIGLGAGMLLFSLVLMGAFIIHVPNIRFFSKTTNQLTLEGLGLLLPITALMFAALLNANGIWLEIWFCSVTIALAIAVMMACNRPREQRRFWVGFAVWGWSYLLLSLFSVSLPLLPSSFLLSQLSRQIPLNNANAWDFEWIGHFAFTLIFAFIGGLLNRRPAPVDNEPIVAIADLPIRN